MLNPSYVGNWNDPVLWSFELCVRNVLALSSVQQRPHANLHYNSVVSGQWDILEQNNIIIIKAVLFSRLILPCVEIDWQCVVTQNIEIHLV